MQRNLAPDRLHLRRIDPAHNMRRFYELGVQRDLFGGAALSREWGRIGSSGQVRRTLFDDEDQAMNALLDLAQAKERRGYRKV